MQKELVKRSKYTKLSIDLPDCDLDGIVEALEGLIPSVWIQDIKDGIVLNEYNKYI